MSKIFAFQVATPLESTLEDEVSSFYDPEAQTTVWSGAGRPLAVRCTRGYIGGKRGCNAYGSYCTTYGGSVLNWGYWCD